MCCAVRPAFFTTVRIFSFCHHCLKIHDTLPTFGDCRSRRLSLQPGHYYSLTAPNLQPPANKERQDQCGNQHYSRELLMMGIVVPETCWAYKKYNKMSSGIELVFRFFSYHNDARSNKHQIQQTCLKYLLKGRLVLPYHKMKYVAFKFVNKTRNLSFVRCKYFEQTTAFYKTEIPVPRFIVSFLHHEWIAQAVYPSTLPLGALGFLNLVFIWITAVTSKQKQFTNNTPENKCWVLSLITYKNQTNGDTKTASEGFLSVMGRSKSTSATFAAPTRKIRS